MRPFETVSQALRFYVRVGQALAGAASPALAPRIDGLDGRGRREDVLAIYLSVAVCLKVLTVPEPAIVRAVIEDPGRTLNAEEARTYHRAMTKLGKEMRRRGVVGRQD